MQKLHFGDLIFTMPKSFPGLEGIVSKAIHLATDGPTHVALAISKKKVIHLDFPLLKIESTDQLLAERVVQTVVSPKLSIVDRIRIRRLVRKLKKEPLRYRRVDLFVIWAASLFPWLAKKLNPKQIPGVCSTFIGWVLNLDAWHLLTPADLIKRFGKKKSTQ